ncbi:hypothetical protein ETU10_02955 [Apibacter muscae]|uniref:hypothetical protein n=1 Tax=Apibacter muscae TaxID=2509004 RepID=UPI0011ADF785|nr:hypothetical protein [Apibacter muscae]TWP24215.1 hypothetical protein ETU10_02955 [Apibacter muscae]
MVIKALNGDFNIKLNREYVLFYPEYSLLEKLNNDIQKYINTGLFHRDIKIGDVNIEEKVYENLLVKYEIDDIKNSKIEDFFNKLVYIILKETQVNDIMVVGLKEISYESIKLIIKNFYNVAIKFNKTIIFIDYTKIGIRLEEITIEHLMNFDNWYEYREKENFNFKNN